MCAFRARNVPVWTRRKVRDFYDNRYQTGAIFEEEKIMQPLPPALRSELLKSVHSEFIEHTHFFKTLEEQIVLKICNTMEPLFLSAGYVWPDPSRMCRNHDPMDRGQLTFMNRWPPGVYCCGRVKWGGSCFSSDQGRCT